MKMNMDALHELELKLAEYGQENGAIAEHESANSNCLSCQGSCGTECVGTCHHTCAGSCSGRK